MSVMVVENEELIDSVLLLFTVVVLIEIHHLLSFSPHDLSVTDQREESFGFKQLSLNFIRMKSGEKKTL